MPARQPRRTAAAYTPAVTPPVPPTVPVPTVADAPDGDGVRWELVDRMRALIAADALDTPDRWVIAEELLFGEMTAAAVVG